jgi:hypothetical protein
MSWVSNVVVSADIQDRHALELLSSWLREEAPKRDGASGTGVGFLDDLTPPEANNWGGWKNPECHLWGGALNHADLDAVIAKFASLPWQVPAAAQLFVMDQEQSYFRLWMLRDGQAHQYAPAPPPDDTSW